jgi:glycine/D-amino acid oxidase-like deaminating enzyme
LSAAATDRRPGELPAPGLRRSWWLREALEAEGDIADAPRLEGEVDADVAIIGGGYTGLWTAWFVAERDPSARIVLLEEDICGGGPSGRNGGFVHGWWESLGYLAERYGPTAAVAIAHAADEVVDGIGQWCDANRVDAWYTKAGYLRVNGFPGRPPDWDEEVARVRQAGESKQLVPMSPDEVQARCASPAFREGLMMPSAASIQPARLARGLRRVLLDRGVRIHERTRVRALRDGSGPLQLETDAGRVFADQAVLAINAWASGWPGFRTRVLAWGSYIVLTEPIPDRLASLGWTGGEAITDCRFTNHYFRTTADGRIAFGGGGGRAGYGGRLGSWTERDRGSTALAARGFRRIFPMLDDVALVDAWGGPIDIASDHLPSFGAMPGSDGKVLFGHGYSGTGLGPSWLGGQILAALARDAHDDPVARLPMVGHRPRRFPPEPFRFLGARVIREAIVATEQRDDLGGYVPPPLRWLVRLPRAMGYDLGPE